ncbi:hypothetical protein TNCV_5105441 [Trichonephila clavipes]|nr:hypothetical protein TNCV_5105441 [Trichonephila clavipes]
MSVGKEWVCAYECCTPRLLVILYYDQVTRTTPELCELLHYLNGRALSPFSVHQPLCMVGLHLQLDSKPRLYNSSFELASMTTRLLGQNDFALFQPNFEGEQTPFGWSGTTHLSSSSTNLTRGLAARRVFKVPPCREGTIHLQASMSPPGFEPRPNGTAVSVANHYTGWATSVNELT